MSEFKVGDVVKYKNGKIKYKVLKTFPTFGDDQYIWLLSLTKNKRYYAYSSQLKLVTPAKKRSHLPKWMEYKDNDCNKVNDC